MTVAEPTGKPCIWGGLTPCGEPGRLYLGGCATRTHLGCCGLVRKGLPGNQPKSSTT